MPDQARRAGWLPQEQQPHHQLKIHPFLPVFSLTFVLARHYLPRSDKHLDKLRITDTEK
jgi:hypothetical protein